MACSGESYDDGSCKDCGAKYHCDKCGSGTGMMGHWTRDSDGDFYTCQDPERLARKAELERLKREQVEKEQLYKLIVKHEAYARSVIDRL